MEIRIKEPFTKDKIKGLKAGDSVLLTGTIYTARDAAHKRITEMLERGENLPFALEDSAIYYVGPTPAKEGMPIGSAGPTTSYRMDAYAPALLDLGQTVMIGKGQRNEDVKAAVLKNGAVYLAAIGGAAALMAKSIKSSEVIAFDDLGAEAVRKLYVEDFPVTVILDAHGGDLYKQGRENYLKSINK
ncbi:MAG: Fe-S-containing hydro-lyase [Bacillota bacterium]|nr:Fe-S-containing hydro-lyase [Bacillota bacterium]